MPGFDDYVKDITNLQKGPGSVATHEQWRDLARWYGDALREYIEKQTFPAKLPAKLDAQKKILNKLASPWPGIGPAVGGTVTPEYLKREAQQFADEAARQRKRGDDDHRAGNGDEASEAYVDSAVSHFRAALAFVGVAGATVDYSKDDPRNGALNYAIQLTEAAQALVDAAANEAAADTSEIAAERLVGQMFAAVAAKAIDDLEAGVKAKGVLLDAAGKTVVANAKTAAKAALDAANTQLKSVEK
jgi:hypothetical protein